MINENFIFSTKKSVQVKRHIVFWFCWWLYAAGVHAANPMGKPEISYFRNIPFALSESILLLIPQMVLTYYMLYFVTPRFLFKNKYWLAFIWSIPGWFFTVLLAQFLIQNVNAPILSFLLPEKYMRYTERSPAVNFFMGLMLASKAALTIAAMGVGIKFIKHWYLKEQRNRQLQKENAAAQLKLLTAQVHPHFLFNTLNNIYSQTQVGSPKGSKMIVELSELLRYILAEGSKNEVPLDKELVMLQHYINLEKARYGNKLDLFLSLPEETGNLQIAPLLLLPFVENCFKHGASKFLSNPWINFTISLDENRLFFKLMNGKNESTEEVHTKSGTGIKNVQKRLNLLYPNKHQLQVSDEKEVFVINLWIELTVAKENNLPITSFKPSVSYA